MYVGSSRLLQLYKLVLHRVLDLLRLLRLFDYTLILCCLSAFNGESGLEVSYTGAQCASHPEPYGAESAPYVAVWGTNVFGAEWFVALCGFNLFAAL